MLRNGGQETPHHHDFLGTNSRLAEIQAAILRVKLPYLDAWNIRRQLLAVRYDAALRTCDGLALPTAPAEVEHVYHHYVVRTPIRDAGFTGSLPEPLSFSCGCSIPRSWTARRLRCCS